MEPLEKSLKSSKKWSNNWKQQLPRGPPPLEAPPKAALCCCQCLLEFCVIFNCFSLRLIDFLVFLWFPYVFRWTLLAFCRGKRPSCPDTRMWKSRKMHKKCKNKNKKNDLKMEPRGRRSIYPHGAPPKAAPYLFANIWLIFGASSSIFFPGPEVLFPWKWLLGVGTFAMVYGKAYLCCPPLHRSRIIIIWLSIGWGPPTSEKKSKKERLIIHKKMLKTIQIIRIYENWQNPTKIDQNRKIHISKTEN